MHLRNERIAQGVPAPYAKIGFDTPFGEVTLFDKSVDLVSATIVDFDVKCPPVPTPVLAHVSNGSDGFTAGTLVAHVGPNAGLRRPGDTDDAEILNLKKDPSGNIIVSGFGEVQSYSGVTRIYVNAGAGNDQITLDGTVDVPATILGGDGNDTLRGGNGPNTISGGAGNDWIYGGDGADSLSGDAGDDVIFGGKGNDTLSGGDGNDQIAGDEGDDLIYGGSGDDRLWGDHQPVSESTPDTTTNGNNTIFGGDGNDQILGGSGNDSLDGGDGADLINALAGNDTVQGGPGDDIITGDDGNDLIRGGPGNDKIEGDQGNDTIYGDSGFDYIEGGDGNDFLVGGTESDAILGGTGDDTLLGGWGNDVLRGNDGNDYIEGGPGDDDICGQADNDTIWGGTTMAYYSLLGPEPAPVSGGGFDAISCDSPIRFVPPKTDLNPNGEVRGQLFQDTNGNGVHDPAEPGQNGWTVELLGPDGKPIASQLTIDADLNEDGTIDPATESGTFDFKNVPPGNYTLVEVAGGWAQSLPTTPIDPSFGAVYLVTVEAGKIEGPYEFGNYLPASVNGRKFLDLNGNGTHDEGEPYLDGWTIQALDEDNKVVATATTADIDLNGDGLIDPNTERGWYQFTGLRPGNYRLIETLQPGYVQTASPGPVALASGGAAHNKDFGNRPSDQIHGTKWLDVNGDGIRQADEPGLAGVQIYIDLNGNGALDAGEPSTFTLADDPATTVDETGQYAFYDLAPGTYIVREVVPAGYRQTFPVDATGQPTGYTVGLKSGQIVTGCDFGNRPLLGFIGGRKFEDLNRNGNADAGEPGLAGWTIYIDANNNGTLDSGEQSTVTTEDGSYYFANLPAGSYILREVLRNGWDQTQPAAGYYSVNIVASDEEITGLDFGNTFGHVVGTSLDDSYTVALDAQSQVLITGVGQGTVLSHPINFVSSLRFDLLAGNDSMTIDLSKGNPIPAGGLAVYGGSGNNTLTIIGASGPNTVLFQGDSIVFDSHQITAGDFASVQIVGGTGDITMTIASPLPFSPMLIGTGRRTVQIDAGSYSLPAESDSGGPLSLIVDGTGQNTIGGSAHLDQLIVRDAGSVSFAPGGNNALVAMSVTVSGNGTLALGGSARSMP